MNALVPLPVAAATVSRASRAAIAQSIAALLREHEANKTALRAASKRFNSPPTPPTLSVTYRGLFGPIGVDVDPDSIRDLLPNFSPRSRRGRKLRRLFASTKPTMRAFGPIVRRQAWAQRWRTSAASRRTCRARRGLPSTREAIASLTLPYRPQRCSLRSSPPTTT